MNSFFKRLIFFVVICYGTGVSASANNADSTYRLQEISLAETTDVDDSISVTPSQYRKIRYMDIQTNMIYDALLIPNIGIEYYLGKNWSVVTNIIYSWWNSDQHH